MRTNLYLKVQLDHEPDDDPARIAEEICRQLRKLFYVRTAEVSSVSDTER